MPPDPVGLRSLQAVAELGDRRCSARCVVACTRAALAAGEEGSGLALTIPGAETRCRFHHAVAHADRYRRPRLLAWHLLHLLRRGRRRILAIAIAASGGVQALAAGIVSFVNSAAATIAAAAASVLLTLARTWRLVATAVRQAADGTLDTIRAGVRAGSARLAATRQLVIESRDGLAHSLSEAPPCSAACLMRCARLGLSAGLEGSGLGLTPAGHCRFHRAVLESDRGVLRRTIAMGLTAVRAPRAWTRRVTARGAVAIGRVRLVETQARARVRALETRLQQRTRDGAVAISRSALLAAMFRVAFFKIVVAVRSRVRQRIALVALAVRRLVARARPEAWWPALRYRARVHGEARLRRTIDGITELVVLAVPKPKPPIRSVAHVSLISHKQYMLSRLARNHGLKGTFLAINTYPNAHLKIGFDYEVPMNMDPFRRYLRASWYLWRVLAFHDVIHYHFNGFLFDDGTDLRVLQRMGKVIVVHYRGCDLRCRSINMAKNPDLNVCQECSYPVGSCDTDYQRNKIAISRTYSDIKFVTTPDLLDFSEDAEHLPFIAPYAIDFSAIEPAPRPPGVFRVVTSSNHPALDGVRFVRDAVERLAAEGVKIELVEIYRQAFHEALALYKSADLYCGKLRMGYYNNANIESLMLGVPNMCYIREQYLDRIPDSPIIVARPDNVYEKLREWVAKPEELKRLGAQGPDFVRRHHQADELMVRMVARYNEALQRKVAARCDAALQSSALP